MKQLLVVGTGSQARYVIDIVKQSKDFEVVGMADVENESSVGQSLNGIKISCSLSGVFEKYPPQKNLVIVAYGNNQRKKEIVQTFKEKGYSFATVVSSRAYVSPDAALGSGCILNPGAVVMPNATLGDHVILHSQCVVEHDNVIADYVNLAPGVALAGRVHIGEGAVLYTGACVIPDITIGEWAVVAAGSVVTKNIPARSRVGGVPARPLPSQ